MIDMYRYISTCQAILLAVLKAYHLVLHECQSQLPNVQRNLPRSPHLHPTVDDTITYLL